MTFLLTQSQTNVVLSTASHIRYLSIVSPVIYLKYIVSCTQRKTLLTPFPTFVLYCTKLFLLSSSLTASQTSAIPKNQINSHQYTSCCPHHDDVDIVTHCEITTLCCALDDTFYRSRGSCDYSSVRVGKTNEALRAAFEKLRGKYGIKCFTRSGI